MKKMKKILSLLLAISMIAGMGSYAATQVKAAENPKYMAKFVPGAKDNIYHDFEFKANTVYVFTCKYYKDATNSVANFQVFFSSNLGEQKIGDGEFQGKNTGSGNQYVTKELTVKYKTSDQETKLAIGMRNNNGSVGQIYYFWDIKVCEEGSNKNLLTNADFTEGEGSWIGWRLAKYSSNTVTTKAESIEAVEATGHSIVAYDAEKCGDYSMVPSYTWDATNKKFTFDYDGDLNLSTYTRYHVQKEGAAFLGWTYEDGTPLTSDKLDGYKFKAGDVIKAQYLEFDSDANDEDRLADFAIRSEEMRTDGTLGVRFTVELSNSLMNALPNVSEFGTIVLPSKILDETTWTMNDQDGTNTYSGKWADLTYDGTYGANDEIKPTIVKAKNIYETLDDRIYYTLCIKDLTEDKYDRQYTVKGYIKYTDKNGGEQVLYTDYSSTNAYLVSQADLVKTDVSDDTKEILRPIVTTINEKYQRERDAVDSTKEGIPEDELIGTSGANETIYKLTSGGKKLRVREVKFDFGLTEPMEVIHLSDLHWNYLNQFDFADANPTLLYTYNNRKNWTECFQGGFVERGKQLLEYARTADELVITGDVMDYLSKGAAELVQREIWSKYPSATIAFGNHEISQKMGNVTETMSRQNRFAWLNSFWKHTSDYSSKVVDEKLMLIQLDNSENVFNETQYTQLNTDIQSARDAGYKILLFMHEPMSTGDPDDAKVVPVLKSNDYSTKEKTYDFYNHINNETMHPIRGGYTKSVYDLITSSSDVIKGVFNGHLHGSFYTEIHKTNEDGSLATNEDGTHITIPQYTVGAGYERNMIKILVQ